ncbi:hypothetical protein N8500_04605 [Candidatus Puniceispirillum sp.]|nr:hypothetical protein [Candidatus Puniceispirillum sp.]
MRVEKMAKKYRVGVLSTIGNPLLPLFVTSILNQKITDILVIFDSKTRSKKDKDIWVQRAGHAFEKAYNAGLDIHSLCDAQVPFYFVKSHNDHSTIRLIKALSIDVLLNAGTPRKLSQQIINSVPFH